jgi:diguanylate cyclase (GGDEF)-like protein
MASKDGEKRIFECNRRPIYNGHGRKLGAMVAMHDITERRRAEARLAHQAQTDPSNRLTLIDCLHEALDSAKTRPNSVAVLFLDLDHLKTINHSLGDQAGDHALIAIAKRLQGAVRETDILAQLGGDEFLILCEDLAGKQETIELSKRIQAVVGAPLALKAQVAEISETVSIGIALSHGGQHAEDLVRNADKATNQASNAWQGLPCVAKRQIAPLTA